jgi:hypothetical protein
MTIDGYDTPITLAATTTIAEDAVCVDDVARSHRRRRQGVDDRMRLTL